MAELLSTIVGRLISILSFTTDFTKDDAHVDWDYDCISYPDEDDAHVDWDYDCISYPGLIAI